MAAHRTRYQVAKAALFAAQVLRRDLIAAGRKDEVEEIMRFVASLAPETSTKPTPSPSSSQSQSGSELGTNNFGLGKRVAADAASCLRWLIGAQETFAIKVDQMARRVRTPDLRLPRNFSKVTPHDRTIGECCDVDEAHVCICEQSR